MTQDVSASGSHIRIDRDLHLFALLTEVQVFREHPPVVILVVHPVVPRVLHSTQEFRSDQGTAHPTAVDPDFLLALISEVFQFRSGVFAFERVVEIREVESVRVCVPAHAYPAAVHVISITVRVVAEAYIHRLIQHVQQDIFRNDNIVIHHKNIVIVPVDRLLYNPVSGGRAVVPSYKIKIGGVLATLQIPD